MTAVTTEEQSRRVCETTKCTEPGDWLTDGVWLCEECARAWLRGAEMTVWVEHGEGAE